MALAELADNHVRFNPYHEELTVDRSHVPVFQMVAAALNEALVGRDGQYYIFSKPTDNDLTRHPLGENKRRVIILSRGADLDFFDFVVQSMLELRTEFPITEALRGAITSAARVTALLYRGYGRVRENVVNFISHDPVIGLTTNGRIVL